MGFRSLEIVQSIVGDLDSRNGLGLWFGLTLCVWSSCFGIGEESFGGLEKSSFWVFACEGILRFCEGRPSFIFDFVTYWRILLRRFSYKRPWSSCQATDLPFTFDSSFESLKTLSGALMYSSSIAGLEIRGVATQFSCSLEQNLVWAHFWNLFFSFRE